MESTAAKIIRPVLIFLARLTLARYLPRVVAVHMNPGMESEIRDELNDVAAALGTEIIPAREGLTLRL